MSERFLKKIFALLLLMAFAPVFATAQTDVPRQTVAVTYPLGEEVVLAFRGTTRFPRLKGVAKIKRQNRTGTRVTLTVDNVPRPYELGEAYTTFVLWAITPEGRSDNLGEIKRRSNSWIFDSKIDVTSPLQTFALIVTAEPHFLVKQPSKAVILENLAPAGETATTLNIQYFGNSSDYFNNPRVAEIADADYVKTPVSLLGARQSLELAKFAGAQRDAPEEFEYAQKSLEQAENSWKSRLKENDIDVLARQATAAGVRAEELAVLRKKARIDREAKLRADAEIERAELRTEDAKAEIDSIRTELNREIRERELLQRDRENDVRTITDLRAENQRLREELAELRRSSEESKIQLARIEGEKQAEQTRLQNEQAERARQEKNAQIQQNLPLILQNLRQFGTLRQTAYGSALVLPETIWQGTRVSGFAPNADVKIQTIAQVLANNSNYKIVIESHTDDKGDAAALQTLTQERAQAIADLLISNGVAENRIEVRGAGATSPLVANSTNANRAKNRRTEISLTPIFE